MQNTLVYLSGRCGEAGVQGEDREEAGQGGRPLALHLCP